MVDPLREDRSAQTNNDPSKRILAVVTTGGFTHAGECQVLPEPKIDY